ncbi:MAG: vWA domain-containing protein [Candidatus Competibacterales bacterium]|nr:vWA domain-containing protein [Candidatus Competibacterales bacterium]
MIELAFDRPLLLLLLPLSLLPLLVDARLPRAHPAPELLPGDGLSRLLDLLVRVAGAALVAALVLGLAGLHRPAHALERLGQGAEIVLLLDRSSSMDRPFAGDGPPQPALAAAPGPSKGTVARRLLSAFVAQRQADRYGMLMFSTHPVPTVPLTDRAPMVQAAIAAGDIGRGLARTNLGAGLGEALAFFDQRPFTGSRLVLLVSDGGARLDRSTRQRIADRARRNRVALYWIYIRSRNSPGLDAGLDAATAREIAPEQLLHQFFQSLDVPYRAYSAEDPEALARAIADVNRLQQLPIRYPALQPRRDLAGWCYGTALGLLLPLLGLRLLEPRADS